MSRFILILVLLLAAGCGSSANSSATPGNGADVPSAKDVAAASDTPTPMDMAAAGDTAPATCPALTGAPTVAAATVAVGGTVEVTLPVNDHTGFAYVSIGNTIIGGIDPPRAGAAGTTSIVVKVDIKDGTYNVQKGKVPVNVILYEHDPASAAGGGAFVAYDFDKDGFFVKNGNYLRGPCGGLSGDSKIPVTFVTVN